MSAPPPAAAEAQPIGAEEFAQALAQFAPFEPRPRLAVAVSGGPDSMALALLARDWVRGRQGALIGFIVDHGLRPESRAEAQRVRQRLSDLGIDAEVLTWQGGARTRLQERARAARYQLLREACRRHRILHLLTGHHLDDQLETVAMREARGSGIFGLAGMPAERFFPEVRLLRPLLAFPRLRLEATVRQAGIASECDPLNLDPRFARARLRAVGLERDRLLALQAAAVARRRELDQALAELACHAVRLWPLGWAELAHAPFAAADEKVAALLLAQLVTTLSGREHPPRSERVRQATRQLRADSVKALTLGGCILRRRTRVWTLCREPAAVAPLLVVQGPTTLLFDGRFQIQIQESDTFTLLSFAEARRRRLVREAEKALRSLPAAARLSLPVLLWEEEVVAAPPDYRAKGGLRIQISLRPQRRFLEAAFFGALFRAA